MTSCIGRRADATPRRPTWNAWAHELLEARATRSTACSAPTFLPTGDGSGRQWQPHRAAVA
eukprot:4901330-Pyramimonas_sp.AAC.1